MIISTVRANFFLRGGGPLSSQNSGGLISSRDRVGVQINIFPIYMYGPSKTKIEGDFF